MMKKINFITLILTFIMISFFSMSANAKEISKFNEYAGLIEEEYLKGNIYIIAKDGSGDFSTIQEGVDRAKDKDTLIIKEGIYNESVEIFDKAINLIGVDKEKCILIYNNVYYWRIPLTIPAGNIKNLTIYGTKYGNYPKSFTAEEISKRYNTLSAWLSIKNVPGYAIHIEQDFLYGRNLNFENCRIISDSSTCVGIGGRGGCNITFVDCEFLSTEIGSCIFMHDSADPSFSGDMALLVKNCVLDCRKNVPTVAFQSIFPTSRLYVTFQNVTVNGVNETVGVYNLYNSDVQGWCGINNVFLTSNSYGNSLDIMNAN